MMSRSTVVRLAVATAALAAVAMAVPFGPRSAIHAAQNVESQFAATGPWAVSHSSFDDPASGLPFELVYPTDLGANGFEHPIVTWGNGSFAVPGQYSGLLDHLASWGFVVVASTSTQTGTGTEILAGAHAMVAADADPSSPFFAKLDTDAIAAVGHSQGAGGSVNATIASAGLITTTVPIALPAQIWVSKAEDAFDVSELTDPVLFLGGSLDLIISGPLVNTGYFNRVPGPAAVGVLRGAGHNTIQNTGGRFLGYITAWLMFQTQDDATAATAFTGSNPELLSNSAWSWQKVQHL